MDEQPASESWYAPKVESSRVTQSRPTIPRMIAPQHCAFEAVVAVQTGAPVLSKVGNAITTEKLAISAVMVENRILNSISGLEMNAVVKAV